MCTSSILNLSRCFFSRFLMQSASHGKRQSALEDPPCSIHRCSNQAVFAEAPNLSETESDQLDRALRHLRVRHRQERKIHFFTMDLPHSDDCGRSWQCMFSAVRGPFVCVAAGSHQTE